MNQESLINRVNKGLNEIRPYLETDGGDLSLVKITSEFVVFIRFFELDFCRIRIYQRRIQGRPLVPERNLYRRRW